MPIHRSNRRQFAQSLGLSSLFAAKGAFAQALTLTPPQTLGPYYPNRLPLDQDNDLILINDSISPAVGEVTWLTGKVLDQRGQPAREALVEIWQADNNGAYIHTGSPIANRDLNFQGYGKFLTGTSGQYLFRTVKPGLYPGRTRHIHYKITYASGQSLVTQLYVQGDALNANDGVLNGIRDTAQRSSVVVPWTPIADSRTGELAANFDIVLGWTPADVTSTRPSILLQNGIVSGAGYQPGITPGAWISIFGDNLAQSSRLWNPSTEIVNGKLPLSLDGVSVTFNGTPAPIYYVSPGQLNVQAPALSGSQTVQVVIRNANGESAPVNATLQTVLPGFFLYTKNYVAATRDDGTLIGPSGMLTGAVTAPAVPGEVIALYGTGFGPTDPAVAPGETFSGAAPLSSQVAARIGGVQADVRFAGISSAGLNQINIVTPNLADGDHDVVATIQGVRSQPLARIRIGR